MMEFFEVVLEFFFIGWFWGYHWFFYDKPSPDDGSLLYWLSLGFLAFTVIRHGCIIVALFYVCALLPVYICYHSVAGVIRLIIMFIKASYACFSRSNDVDSEREDEDIVCCICLGNCGDEKEGKLPCSHVFHLKCIRRWLRIRPTCPLCQSQFDVFPTLLYLYE
ncbi:E3 ubiquitin protein ligase RIE1-like [Raphanus sativus]|uniref:E3 ubiquitin protein ligase RIE1-like n=1 Tax=Raphanus sativus TaxID=3726 RepID=A0A6J0NWR3_RAPSA|nr:E3 ubiquitin protein ligase RIE1-like [Raphanus sativus]